MSKKRRLAGGPPPRWPGIIDSIQEGDCVAGMRDIPDESVDLICADPPFNIGRDYDGHDDDLDPAAYLHWTAGWVDQCVRVLKPTGSLWICASEEVVSEIKVIAEGRYVLGYLDDAAEVVSIRRYNRALKPRHHVIWYYTFGVNAPKKLTRSHTHLLHFVKSLKKHRWNEDAVRLPSARQAVYNDKRASPAGRLPDDTWIIRPQSAAAGLDPGDDVQHHSRVCGTYKERCAVDNQMPEQLMARIVRLCTDPGDLVLSPFCGSGTDAVVAKKLGRHYLTYDVSDGYVAQALLRLQAAREGDMLDAPDAVAPPPRRKSRAT